MNSVDHLVRQDQRFGALFRIQPLISPTEAKHFLYPVCLMHFEKQRPDDIVESGSPPQVTMPARVSGGLKNRCSRAPASSKSRPSSSRPSTVRTTVAGTRSDSLTQRLRGDGKRATPRTGRFMANSSIIPRSQAPK